MNALTAGLSVVACAVIMLGVLFLVAGTIVCQQWRRGEDTALAYVCLLLGITLVTAGSYALSALVKEVS